MPPIRLRRRPIAACQYHSPTRIHSISFSRSTQQVSDKIDDEFPLLEDYLIIQINGGLADDTVQVDLGLDRTAGQRCTAPGADVGPTMPPLAFKTRILADEGCSGVGPNPPGGELVRVPILQGGQQLDKRVASLPPSMAHKASLVEDIVTGAVSRPTCVIEPSTTATPEALLARGTLRNRPGGSVEIARLSTTPSRMAKGCSSS